MNIALIIAGGSGNRMGQDIPKQFMHVDGSPIIIQTMLCFQRHPDIEAIAVVCLRGWETVLQSYANQFNVTKVDWEYEFKNPYLAKSTKDWVKEIVNKEFDEHYGKDKR